MNYFERLPSELQEKLKKRDKSCAYCNIKLKWYPNTKGTPGDKATLEHIDNDEYNLSESNIVLSCNSCNASKGTKKLSDWLKLDYCKRKNINEKTIKNVIVRKHL